LDFYLFTFAGYELEFSAEKGEASEAKPFSGDRPTIGTTVFVIHLKLRKTLESFFRSLGI